MNLPLQRFLLAAFCVLIAIYVSFDIAQGDYGWATLLGACATLAILKRAGQIRTDALILGAVVFGYYAGNRGFAQQTLFAGLPLFPAELALAGGAVWLVLQGAIERRLPVEKDPLHLLIATWIILGSVRLGFDLPRFGLMALRDYATVYYAGFFFIAQNITAHRERRFLFGCLLAGGLILPVIYPLFIEFQPFFVQNLSWRNTPLIYLKGDVAVPLAGAGIFLLHLHPTLRQQRWSLPAALVILLFVFASNSRAAQFGVLAVDAGLLVRRSRVPWWHAGTLTVAALGLAALAYSGQARWAEEKLQNSFERVASMADFAGTGQYRSEALADKADNNRFRVVWWRVVATETWETNPAFGLGFGYDLARGFVREYDPGMADEFSARSPHNVMFTVLGRLGIAGVLVAGAIVVVMLRRTIVSLQLQTEGAAYWCMAWVILVSACFGVVLEGPMGAVPFWTLLGLASTSATRKDWTEEESASSATASLHPAELGT